MFRRKHLKTHLRIFDYLIELFQTMKAVKEKYKNFKKVLLICTDDKLQPYIYYVNSICINFLILNGASYF